MSNLPFSMDEEHVKSVFSKVRLALVVSSRGVCNVWRWFVCGMYWSWCALGVCVRGACVCGGRWVWGVGLGVG